MKECDNCGTEKPEKEGCLLCEKIREDIKNEWESMTEKEKEEINNMRETKIL